MKFSIITSTVLLLGLTNAIQSSAQELKLSQIAKLQMVKGQVLDQKTKSPLVGVDVKSVDSTVFTHTDIDGYFELSVLENNRTLTFSYFGYEAQTQEFPNNTESWVVSLKESTDHATNLKGVTVVGRKATTSISTSGVAKVERIGAGELMKAACCNLSESFETTPSVDVGFTDAVSGYKQIQMLGLAGAYTSFTRENIPDVRGLAAITGLTFTPGTFVESMQLSKGAGSVVNGFEGTAGQINVEWLKPFEKSSPSLVLNAYQSIQGRTEGNAIWNHAFNRHLSTSVLLHGRSDWRKVDMNNDGFLDNPRGESFVVSNRWFYFGDRGLEIQGGVKAVQLSTLGGQKSYERGMAQDSLLQTPWGYENEVKRLETWAKIGKVFPAKPYKSMGLQLSAVFHDQENKYGKRSYLGKQESYYANYIFQTIIGNTNNTIKFGASAAGDKYRETIVNTPMQRSEFVTGAFAEYAYKWNEKINVVAGLRGDYHNLFGFFATPRLHFRYAPNEKTAFRASVGRAQRTANVIAENMGLMASGRALLFNGQSLNQFNDASYPFKPEVAWNMGVNMTKKFLLNYRDGSIGVDYYYTNFTNQVVVDMEAYDKVNFYNLNGKSYAHSFQAQLDYEPIRMLDVRLAYRFYDVKSQYGNELLQKPLVAAHRAFANLAYSTKNNWKFDYTVQWVGSKRMPQHFHDHHDKVGAGMMTPSFWMMNAQINKTLNHGRLNLYAGMENIMNVMQHPLIVGAANPYSQTFDASLIWGSGMGRNLYVGFKLNIMPKGAEHTDDHH